jgi:hypothetical protein
MMGFTTPWQETARRIEEQFQITMKKPGKWWFYNMFNGF